MKLDELAERELSEALKRFSGWQQTAVDNAEVCNVASWSIAVANMLGKSAAVLAQHVYETHSGEVPAFPLAEMDDAAFVMLSQIVRDSFDEAVHARS